MNSSDKVEYKRQQKEIKRLHKEMLLKEEAHRREEKVAPEGVYISLKNINKVYDNHVQAVYDFNLDINKHELIVFVGPSGCGKSTTLRMIAGLEEITTGDLFIDGIYSNELTSKERDISMVFQSYALYPHMTVYKNMAFGLKVRKIPKDEIHSRVLKAAEILQITEYLDRKPKALSGGQRQRVALGRAIVRNAKVFLMDEPLSNLDAKLRVSMRSEIIKLHKQLNATTIYVTHDQTEAMTMADRIVVMKDGYIQQIGSPSEIYNHPANSFVATFIGSPSMNLLKASIENNTIIFNNAFKIKLNNTQIEAIKNFYQTGLDNATKELKKLESTNEAKLLLLEKIKVSESEEEIQKFNSEIEIIDKANIKRNELINIIDEYTTSIKNNKYDILFGIRPDNIIETSELNKKIEPSDPFTCKINVTELLGNQYYLHTTFAGEDLLINTPADRIIHDQEDIEVCINLNKMHLFDRVTQKIVL